MVRRLAAGVCGVGAAAIASWGAFTSLGGTPELSLRRSFISDAAMPWNPLADRLNTCLEIAGVLVVAFAIAEMMTVRSRVGRAAAVLAAVAGVSLSLVGVYPMTDMTAHTAVTIGVGTSGLTAAILAAVAARRATRESGRLHRRLGYAAMATATGAAVVLGAGAGYLAWVSARVWPGSAGELFRVLPGELPVRIGDHVHNPVANLEWVYFGLLVALLVGFAAAEAVGVSGALRRTTGGQRSV